MRQRSPMRKLLRQLGANAGLLALGVCLGGGAFVALDMMKPPAARSELTQHGAFYQTCREAFQDGRTNIRRGEPGYRAELDADGDGLACEPYVPLRPAL